MTLLYALLILATYNLAEILTRVPLLATLGGLLATRLYRAKHDPSYVNSARLYLTPRDGIPDTMFDKRYDAAGTAIGTIIIVEQEHRHDRGLVHHEAVHVQQWRRYGTFGFLAIFAFHYARLLVQHGNLQAAYWHHPFEIEAYRAQHGPSWTPPS